MTRGALTRSLSEKVSGIVKTGDEGDDEAAASVVVGAEGMEHQTPHTLIRQVNGTG